MCRMFSLDFFPNDNFASLVEEVFNLCFIFFLYVVFATVLTKVSQRIRPTNIWQILFSMPPCLSSQNSHCLSQLSER